MFQFDRPVADRLIRPLQRKPVLSIVIPTFGRPEELTLAISSIVNQIDAALEGKVEIIVSDNASGPDTHAVLTRLAATYPWFGYYIHAENYGGMYQVCSAADRATGRWTWVFGDDDALGPGGLKAVIDVLEREQPAFLTVNRQVWNKTLDQCLIDSRHDLPDTGFATFLDLLGVFGFDQLSFFTSQIYDTEAARAVDAGNYVNSLCRYAQLAYYLEGFHDRSAYYLSAPVVWHRWDKDDGAVHAANFHSLATLLPDLVQLAADRVGLEPGLFEKISGRRSLLGPATRETTFVDNILQNLWRCVATGASIPEEEWEVLHRLAPQWRAGRAQDLADVHQTYSKIASAFAHYQGLVANHQACAAPGRAYSPQEIDLLQQSEAAIRTLQSNINDARKMATDIAGGFD
jgi:glycosyltransferase involved in cell wall biosynthesis